MTREEAIKTLKGEAWICCAEKWNEALDMAVSALSEDKGEWIPVTERLPEDRQKVIVTYKNVGGEYVISGTFDKKYGFNFPTVKAWMPLPEAYKEGGE